MTEVIIKVDSGVLEKMKDRGMEEQYELIRCEQCENHRTRIGMCDVWHAHTPSLGYCYRGRKYGKKTDGKRTTERNEE